jgi:hypothetical protein
MLYASFAPLFAREVQAKGSDVAAQRSNEGITKWMGLILH